MKNEEYSNTRVQHLQNIVRRASWSELSSNYAAINSSVINECEKFFISQALNISLDTVNDYWQADQDFQTNFITFIKSFLSIDQVPKTEIYKKLLHDSIIPKSSFIKSFFESSVFNSKALLAVFTSEAFHKVYTYVEKFDLFEETTKMIKIQITSEKLASGNSEPIIDYTVKKNDEFFIKQYRNDNFIIIGKNKSSPAVDANMFNDQQSEDVLGIIALKHDGAYISDLSTDCTIGFMIDKPVPIHKNTIFKLGKLAQIFVLNLRSSWSPYITLKCGSDEPKTFTDVTEDIIIGKNSLQFPCVISGVSNYHCAVYFDKTSANWMLKDNESTNGTYLQLKNILEYSSNSASSPKKLESDTEVLLIGTQIALIISAKT